MVILLEYSSGVKESTSGLELLKVESRINVIHTHMLLMIHAYTLNTKVHEFSRNSVAVEAFSGKTFFKVMAVVKFIQVAN